MPGEQAARDPCPGCGRLIAYARRVGRERWDQRRVDHRCAHGTRCIGHQSHQLTWSRGDWRHWRACRACAEAARIADGAAPTDFDCWRCQTPLAFEPDSYVDLCPPQGSVTVTGVTCPHCGAESAYRIVGQQVERFVLGARTGASAAPS